MKKKQYQYTSMYRGRPVIFRGDSIELLASSVLAFNHRNGIRPNKIDAVIEEVRKMHKLVDSIHSSQLPKTSSSGITLHAAFNAAKAFIKYGYGDTVSQKEVDQRCATCLKCEKITQASNCMSCGGSRIATNLVTSVKALFKKNLRFDETIKRSYCGVCGCSLSLITPTKMDGFTDEMFNKKDRPAHCWLKK